MRRRRSLPFAPLVTAALSLPVPLPTATALSLPTALLVAAALSPAALRAQVEMSASSAPAGAVLSGVVVDSITGHPIEGVLVRIDSGHEAMTDGRGEFEIAGLPEGKRLIALLTSDCRITWGRVTVLARFPRDIELRLPPAFGAAAEEQTRTREARQRTGGRFVEADEIARMNARSMIDVIRRIQPGMISGNPGQVGATPTITSGRNRSFVEQDPPVVVVDGVRIPNPEIALAQMSPSEVRLLEVLPGAAAGWEYGSAGAGGVIKITLRRGLATGAPDRRTAAPCVVPAFPGR